MGVYRGYDDAWIAENIGNYPSWKKMFEDYYNIFQFGNYRNFRNHLYNDLKYTRLFTKEQDTWIKENYPLFGLKKTTEEFGRVFPCGRSKTVIAQRAMQLGVTVSEDTLTKIRKDTTVKRNVGDKVIRTNKNGVSSVYVKLPSGEWKRESHVNYGKVPDGMRIVHLDGDFTNNEPSNLSAISQSQQALMTVNRFWSEQPEVTKSGIIWCKLKQTYEQKGY